MVRNYGAFSIDFWRQAGAFGQRSESFTSVRLFNTLHDEDFDFDGDNQSDSDDESPVKPANHSSYQRDFASETYRTGGLGFTI